MKPTPIQKLITSALLVFCPLVCLAQEIRIVGTKPINHYFSDAVVSPTGKLIAATIYYSNDVAVFDAITGREVQRLRAKEKPIAVHFADDETIVRIFARGIDFVHLVNDSVISSSPGERMHFRDAWAAEDKRLAVTTAESIIIFDCSAKHARIETIIPVENVSVLRINPAGTFVAARVNDTILCWNTKTSALTVKLPAKDIISFGMTGNGIAILNKYPFSYHKYDFDGRPLAQNKMELIVKPYRTYIASFENGFTFNTYKKTVVTYPTGYQEVITTDLEDHNAYVDWRTGKVYTWNGAVIEVTDMEGALFTRINAQQLGSMSMLPDKEGDKLHVVMDSTISVMNGEKTFKKISLGSRSISSHAFAGNLYMLPLNNKRIAIYDPARQSVKSQFDHHSIPMQYASADNNEIWFVDRLENAVYRLNARSGQKTKAYAHPAIITAISTFGNSVYIGDEKGNVSELKITSGQLKPLRALNLVTNPVTAIKAIDGDVFAASYGRFLSLGKDISDRSAQKLYVGHSGFINSIETNSTGELIYTTGGDGHIRLWDRQKTNAIEDYDLDSVAATQIMYTENDAFMFTGNDFVFGGVLDSLIVKKWKNVDERIVLLSPNSGSPLKLAINRQGNLLAAVDRNTVKVRDIRKGFLINEFSIGEDPLNGIAFSTDGQMLAIASGEFIYLFDPYTGNIIRKIDMSKTSRVGTLNFGEPSLLGRSFHDIEAFQNAFVAFNVFGWHDPLAFHKNSGLKIFEFNFNPDKRFDNQVYDFKCTPDGSWIATYGTSFIKIFSNKDSLKLRYAFPRSDKGFLSEYMDQVSFSADDKHFAWVDIVDGYKKIRIVDLATGNIVKEHFGGVITMAQNGDYYFADTEETITKSNVSSHEEEQLEQRWYKYGQVGVNNLVYNATQNILAASDIWGNIRVIDGRSGKSISELNRMEQYTYQAELSPDKKTMLFNNQWGLFSLDLGSLKREALPGSNYPFSGVFAPGGRKIWFRDKKMIVSKELDSQQLDTVFKSDDLADFAGMSISSDGAHLVIQYNNDEVELVDIGKRKSWFRFNRIGFREKTGMIVKDVVTRDGQAYLKGIYFTSDTATSDLKYALVSTDGKFTLQPLSVDVTLHRGKDGGFDKYVFKADAKIFELSPSGRYLAFMKGLELYIIDNNTKDTVFNRDNGFSGSIVKATFDEKERNFIIGTNDGFVEVYDLQSKPKIAGNKYSGLRQVARFKANEMSVEAIQVEGDRLLVRGGNSFLSLHNLELTNQNKMLDMAFIREADQVYINKEGYYYASKDALNYVAYKRGNDFLSLDLTDLRFNRPDKILRSAQSSDTTLISAYHNAYLKRLKKNRIDSTWQPRFGDIPTCTIVNESAIPYDIAQPSVELKFSMNAVKGLLRSINIWVNNVPVFGRNGTPLAGRSQNDTAIVVRLSKGLNKIEYAVKNAAGMESVRTPLFVSNSSSTPGEKIYFIGIGIDEFRDRQYNLQYSAKDIRDLAAKLREKFGNAIIIDTLFNENVTIGNIKALKEQLLKTTENDKVIVSYSGHGLLSKDYDYYLSTYDVNFSNPVQNGLAYDELENLLDGIAARKKLLLIDACHSGEVDKEEGIAMDSIAAANGLTKGITIKPSKSKQQVGLKNSFEVMQNLFVNVGNSTGTTIISAAAGNQYALERGDLKNGVFTYCLLEAMDNNKSIRVSELKKNVAERVVAETKGLQKPTSRNETLAVDWQVW